MTKYTIPIILLVATVTAAVQAPDTLTVGPSRLRALSGLESRAHSAGWSPMGDSIAFVRGERIWIQASNGSGEARQITSGEDDSWDWYPDFSPDGRTICFSSNRGGSNRIWTVSLDGGEPTPLADLGTSFQDVAPTWSPDGARIAYSALVGRNEDIYTIPAAGGVARRITTDLGRDQFPSWSPDGLTIAYDAARDASQVALISADGGVPHFLPTGKSQIFVPKFSPDGRWILFQSDRMLPRCWIMSVDGGQPMAVTGDDSLETWMADWSPDGTGVTVTRGRQRGRGQLVLIPLQGGSTRILADSVDAVYGYPAWSPDGERVAYVAAATLDLLAIDTGTGRIDTLVASAVDSTWKGVPAWSPDGEWVSFSSNLLGQPNIWIVPVHGGDAQPVTLGAGDHYASVWGRDSERIFFPSLQAGNLDVWSTTIGGDPPVRVTVDAAQDRPVVVSPDGRDFIFVSNRRAAATDSVGLFALWTVAIDGGPPRYLSPLPRRTGQWSASIPDNASLLLAADHTTGEIWIYEPIDSDPRLLIGDSARCPRLSPDETEVVYVRELAAGHSRVYVADVRAIVGGGVLP